MAVYKPKVLNPPPLRTGTPRQELVVGPNNPQPRIFNPASPGTSVGIPTPVTLDGHKFFALGFNRGRVVTALPLKDRRQLVLPALVHDSTIGYLADADGNLIGVPGTWVHRMVSAVSTPTGPRSSAGLQGY